MPRPAARLLHSPDAAQQATVVRLLAGAMRDNPTHVAVFGSAAAARQTALEAFFALLLPYLLAHGKLFGAFAEQQLIGVMGALPPGHCRPGPAQATLLALQLLRRLPLATCWRTGRWLRQWQREDPRQPHFHLGPLAVHPEWRRRGIGSELFAAGCALADEAALPAWLETDLADNVARYHRHGFVLVKTQAVLGVSNYFMWREAAVPALRQPPLATHSRQEENSHAATLSG